MAPFGQSDPTKPPPYLLNPPKVVPIDVGRQLFVDDFLIESTTLNRTHRRGQVHPASPVLRPDRSWENAGFAPKAAPFSGGVWYDPQESLFKMWYKAGWYPRPTCYAFSMDADSAGGTLTTRPVLFKGKHLFVNVDAGQSELRVEVLDPTDKVIAAFSKDNCVPIRADKTLIRVTWKGASDMSPLAGTPVKFRFHLRSGSLYAFWVSPDKSGASYGYVAAGGPGFTGPTDTIGDS